METCLENILAQIFEKVLLAIKNTKATPLHPQCDKMVEDITEPLPIIYSFVSENRD